jgi:hypothetical protein
MVDCVCVAASSSNSNEIGTRPMAQFGRWDGWHARDIMEVYKTVRADEMGRGVFSEKMVEI